MILHLNFDGNGTRISGNFVNGTTSDVQNERVTAYTYHDSDKQLFYISIINKLETNETIRVYLQLDSSQYGDLSKKKIQVYSFKQNTHSTKGVKYLNVESPLQTDKVLKFTFVAEPLSAYLLIMPSVDTPTPYASASKPLSSNGTIQTHNSSRMSGASTTTIHSCMVLFMIVLFSFNQMII